MIPPQPHDDDRPFIPHGTRHDIPVPLQRRAITHSKETTGDNGSSKIVQ